jgi:2-polyprenyl-6-methoxyphenol hydroxylase-like FAD-dependent oxidoreductase
MLLGADGVNSKVRAALQAQVKGFGVRQTQVSAGYKQCNTLTVMIIQYVSYIA